MPHHSWQHPIEERRLIMPIIDVKATGINIKNLQKQRGITVKDIQNVFGFTTPQAIYKWRQGDTLPTLDNILILADIFKVKIDDILVIKRV